MNREKQNKTFLVSYRIFIGEYEKSNKVLVDADNSNAAMSQALLNESHCTEFLDWESIGCVYDDCGGMRYEIKTCEEISDGLELNVLSRHLDHTRYDASALGYAGNYRQLFE